MNPLISQLCAGKQTFSIRRCSQGELIRRLNEKSTVLMTFECENGQPEIGFTIRLSAIEKENAEFEGGSTVDGTILVCRSLVNLKTLNGTSTLIVEQ